MRLLVLLLLVAGSVYADSVAPDTITITNARAEAVADLGRTVYAGQPLVINGVTTGQTLSNVTVIVSVGTAGRNVSATGSVVSATGGTWTASVVVPAGQLGGPTLIQTKLIDASTNSYIYPAKQITVIEGY